MASAGLAALLAASQTAFDLLRLAGAIYVIYLGIGCLARMRTQAAAAADDAIASPPHHGRWFLRGLLTDLLNPKVGVFYVTFLPQFVPDGANVIALSLLLAGIHAALSVVWFCVLAATARGLSEWLRRGRVRATLEGLSGLVLIGFGLKLALAREP